MQGKPAPAVSAPATGGRTFGVADHRGHPLVVYFYPKDNTPGCTTEGAAFRDHYAEFKALGADIVGISRDSVRSHEGFKAKLGLPFDLAADTEEALCQAFDVIRNKKLYGKDVRGIERSTFLIDGQGVIVREWRGVKVAGHVEEILEAVRAFAQRSER